MQADDIQLTHTDKTPCHRILQQGVDFVRTDNLISKPVLTPEEFHKKLPGGNRMTDKACLPFPDEQQSWHGNR